MLRPRVQDALLDLLRISARGVAWTSKNSSKGCSNLASVLAINAAAPRGSRESARISGLIHKIFDATEMFAGLEAEVSAWLKSAIDPGGISFLEAAMTRLLARPYQFISASRSVYPRIVMPQPHRGNHQPYVTACGSPVHLGQCAQPARRTVHTVLRAPSLTRYKPKFVWQAQRSRRSCVC